MFFCLCVVLIPCVVSDFFRNYDLLLYQMHQNVQKRITLPTKIQYRVTGHTNIMFKLVLMLNDYKRTHNNL